MQGKRDQGALLVLIPAVLSLGIDVCLVSLYTAVCLVSQVIYPYSFFLKKKLIREEFLTMCFDHNYFLSFKSSRIHPSLPTHPILLPLKKKKKNASSLSPILAAQILMVFPP